MTRTIFLTFVLAACGSKPATSTTPTQPASTFELGELTVFDGDQAMLKIHADGSTELGGHSGKLEVKPGQTASTDSLPVVWKAGPVFKTDGTIEYKGKAVAKVNADGTVMNLETNKAEPITITSDKATFEKGAIELSADGKMSFVGGNGTPPEKTPHVTGADTPGKRRTVLALVGLMLGGERKVEVDESHSVAEPDPSMKP